MATDLNPGFTNNINTISIRSSGSSLQLYTDRAIDIDADGDEEAVTVVTTLTGDGSKVIETVTVPAGSARTVIDRTVEPDGGIHNDAIHADQYTVGT